MTTFLSASPNRLGHVGHVTAAGGAHQRAPAADAVDTLLSEEKARAKLIKDAKLKFGIIDDVDLSGVRLYLGKGMEFDTKVDLSPSG